MNNEHRSGIKVAPITIVKKERGKMKIIFGKNGTEKTKYAQSMKSKHTVLSSRLTDWHFENTSNQPVKKIEISQYILLIKEKEKELKEILDKKIFEKGSIESANFSGTLASFKKMAKEFKFNFETMSMPSFWGGTNNPKPVLLDINAASLIFSEYIVVSPIIEAMTKLDKSAFRDYLNAKSKLKIKNLDETEGFGKISDKLTEIKRLMKAFEDGCDSKYSGILELSLTAFDAINNHSIEETHDELMNSLKNIILSTSYKEKIEGLINSIADLKKRKMVFNQVNIKEILKDISFSEDPDYSNDNKTITFTSESGFSTGQITILCALSIIVSANNKIILDDVLETLDDENTIFLIENIIDRDEVEVLTHSTSDISLIQKIGEYVDIDVDVSGTKAQGVSSIFTWSQILSNLRGYSPNGDINFIRSIIKILTRYIAKDGTIHSKKSGDTPTNMRLTDNFLHFQTSSWFIHYTDSIAPEIILDFFPDLSSEISLIERTTNTINSIEFHDILISKIRDVILRKPVINGVRLDKIIDHINIIKAELLIEQECFQLNIIEKTPVILKKNEESKFYKKLRKNYNKPNRMNAKIHLLDLTPLPILD